MTEQPAPPTSARPRVVIFRNELLPKSETFVRAQAQALRGFEPVFAGVHPAPTSLALPSAPFFASPHASFFGKVKRRAFWHTGVAPALTKPLQHLAPALLHAHFAIDGAAALALQHRLRCPLVVSLHGYDVSSSDTALRRSPEGRLYLRKRHELWARTSLFLCISEFIRAKAIERGFPQAKLRVHYTGIDLDLFRTGTQERDPNLVLFVGRLVEKKGGHALLAALHLVRQQRPQARLVMIGAGPQEAELRTQAERLQLPCTFLGAQPPEVVSAHLARARVFCVPSMTAQTGDSEGLGMVFAEAQAMGTPVVSFRHGGIPEVVAHEHTGLLATEGDRSALAGHLLRLLGDDTLWQRMSSSGIAWVQERFDLRRQTNTLEAIYGQVCQRPC